MLILVLSTDTLYCGRAYLCVYHLYTNDRFFDRAKTLRLLPETRVFLYTRLPVDVTYCYDKVRACTCVPCSPRATRVYPNYIYDDRRRFVHRPFRIIVSERRRVGETFRVLRKIVRQLAGTVARNGRTADEDCFYKLSTARVRASSVNARIGFVYRERSNCAHARPFVLQRRRSPDRVSARA